MKVQTVQQHSSQEAAGIGADPESGHRFVYLATNAEGLDKVNAAVQETMKSNPLGGSAFDSMTDSFSPPR